MRISIPDTFVSERRYIIDVLCGEFLGLSYEVKIVTGGKDYAIEIGAVGKLVVRDHFFKRFGVEGYLHKANIPEIIFLASNPFTPEQDIPVIYGNEEFRVTKDEIVCGVDLFASAFFMLTRWEEYADNTRDRHGRFPAIASLAHRAGFLHRPIVNEYLDMLWSMLFHLGCRQRRKQHSFTLTLTHDVDDLRRWHLGSAARICAGDVLVRRDLRLTVSNFMCFISSAARLKPDPFDTFDSLMDLSDEVGLVSHFFFMAGGKSPFDSGYPIDSQYVRTLLGKIVSRGHKIGFHPSYDAFDNGSQWGREFQRLSGVSPEPISGGREHYLRFAVPLTWQIWEDHGMEYDSTLGYADCEGFRCGVCYPYSVYNFLSRKKLGLKELPLIVMDGTLLHYKKYAYEQMNEIMQYYYDKIRQYEGNFVVLWHNSSFNTTCWRPYEMVYLDLLKYYQN